MGTTGTITGVSRYLKSMNPAIPHHRCAAPKGLAHSGHPQNGPRRICPKSTMHRMWMTLAYVSQADAEDVRAAAWPAKKAFCGHLSRRSGACGAGAFRSR